MLAGCVIAGTSQVMAGSSCCPMGKKKAEAKSGKGCSELSVESMTEALELSDDQVSQLSALKTECAKTGCAKTGSEKYCEGMEKILTAEQVEKCKALCVEKGVQCPMTKPAEEASAES